MKKNYLIITILIASICILAIGYAAFTSQLKITGTSNITSNWDIKITNITVKNITGGASKLIEPITSGTSATFKTSLISPGDSMTYEVTVTNNGNVDAKVKNIQETTSTNPAIVFETKGINQNDLLEAGNSQTFDVTVSYNNTVTSQPEAREASYTIKLNYIQN